MKIRMNGALHNLLQSKQIQCWGKGRCREITPLLCLNRSCGSYYLCQYVCVCFCVLWQRVLTGSLLPVAAARLFWSIKRQERKDRVTEGHWSDFIETEIKLDWRREQQRDVRETVRDRTETTLEPVHIFKNHSGSSADFCHL